MKSPSHLRRALPGSAIDGLGIEQLIVSGFDEIIFSLPDYDGKRKSVKFAKGGEVCFFGYFK